MTSLDSLVSLSRRLGTSAGALVFAPPVAFVYNPLIYARDPHEQYLERWGSGTKRMLFVGMNPGPFGMMQTGVPFGEVSRVEGWLGISGKVLRPPAEHPKRPVEGFACRRSEVSGARLWDWARRRCVSPESFFAQAFVWNWCPLGFLDAGGRNLTPEKLPRAERSPLEALCDGALAEVAAILDVRWAIGIGAVAEAAIRRSIPAGIHVARIPHPSPASPASHRDWASQVDVALRSAGVEFE
ncbi:MAG: single-stranded DNA-binding protein [Thermoanaerobaculia bacterium]